ncbi:hypothetical protein BY996DRAFT_6411879 [Phakopsora pachyrhizi]|nr:hypothetical protein BY996DRAFT_6411879 [Phakopsora pachyrhizi]
MSIDPYQTDHLSNSNNTSHQLQSELHHHDEESSNDEDDAEAIADALLGRRVNPRLLIGRLNSLENSLSDHRGKEDESINVSDRSSESTIQRATGPSSDGSNLIDSRLSAPLLNRVSYPAERSVDTEQRNLPSIQEAIESHFLPDCARSEPKVALRKNERIQPTTNGLSLAQQSFSLPADGRSKIMESVDHVNNHQQAFELEEKRSRALNPSPLSPDLVKGGRKMSPDTYGGAESCSEGLDEAAPQDECLSLSRRIRFHYKPSEKKLLLETSSTTAENSQLISRLGDQPEVSRAISPSNSSLSPHAPNALRSRLEFPDPASWDDAACHFGRSLLERTETNPSANSITSFRNESTSENGFRRKRSDSNSFDRELSFRPRVDRRRPVDAHYPSRRHNRSRSRSPQRRSAGMSPPSNVRVWGRRSLSPHRRFNHRHGSPFNHPRSNISDWSRPPRRVTPLEGSGKRLQDMHNVCSPPPVNFREYRQNGYLRDASMPPYKQKATRNQSAKYKQTGYLSNRQNATRNACTEIDIQAGSADRDVTLSSQLSADNSEDRVSVLVTNFPSSRLSLSPQDVYKHLVQSADVDGPTPNLPSELTLYRFAGTDRVCGELKFKTRNCARKFSERKYQQWPAEWCDGEIRAPDSHEKLEFTVVESDRTPWPSERISYRPNIRRESDENLAVAKEIGPPTPTSFQSQIVSSSSPANEALNSLGHIPILSDSNPQRSVKKDSSENLNFPGLQREEDLTGVLLTELEACIKVSVLQSHFVAPTRPRHFRMFELMRVSCGMLVPETSLVSKGCNSHNACLIELKDNTTAKIFCRSLEDHKPFHPMRISLVNPRNVVFDPPASIIGGQADQIFNPRLRVHPERKGLILENNKQVRNSSLPLRSPTNLAEKQFNQSAIEHSLPPLLSKQNCMAGFGPETGGEDYQNISPFSHESALTLKPCTETQFAENVAQEFRGDRPMSEIPLNRAEQLRQALLARRSGQQ